MLKGRHLLEMIPIAGIVFVLFLLEATFIWMLISVGAWFCFRIWWFYRRARNEGLFD